MRTRVLFLFISLLILTGMIIGCGSVPQQKVDEANAALEAAKTAEADRYVPDRYNAAKGALDGAMAEVKKQDSKLMFKNFDEAGKMLDNAINLAKEAEQAAVARKQEVSQELPLLMEQLKDAIKQVKTLMKRAPRSKESMMALQSIKNDLDNLERIPDSANAAMQSGDYMNAYNSVKGGIDRANALINELNQAIQAGY
jgi:dsDNA-binding SOS-regulon protein